MNLTPYITFVFLIATIALVVSLYDLNHFRCAGSGDDSSGIPGPSGPSGAPGPPGLSGSSTGCDFVTTNADIGSMQTMSCTSSIVGNNVLQTTAISGDTLSVGFQTPTFCSAGIQWDGSFWQLGKSPDITSVSVGPLGSGALYTTIEQALSASPMCPFVRVLGDISEPNTLTITMSTLIYIDPGVTVTFSNPINVSNNSTFVMFGNDDSNSTVVSYALPLNTSFVNGSVGSSVAFRYLQIRNDSVNNQTPLVNQSPQILVERVRVIIANAIAHGFIGDGTVTPFPNLTLMDIEIAPLAAASFVIDLPGIAGSAEISNVVLSGLYGATAISALMIDSEWNGLTYATASASNIILSGKLLNNIKRNNGAGVLDLTIREVSAGVPYIVGSNINLGLDVLTVLRIITSGGADVPNLSFANIVSSRIWMYGQVSTANNIALCNVDCNSMPTNRPGGGVGWGTGIMITNAMIGIFDVSPTLVNFGTGATLSNIRTFADPVSSLTQVQATRLTLTGWHQLTGRFQPQVTNSALSNVIGYSVGIASASFGIHNSTNSTFANFTGVQGITTNALVNCTLSNFTLCTSGVGNCVLQGSNNRYINFRVVAGTPVQIIGTGLQVTGCDFFPSVNCGNQNVGNILTLSSFANCRFLGSFLLAGRTAVGPVGPFTSRLQFSNNIFTGVVQVDNNLVVPPGEPNVPSQDITWTGNLFSNNFVMNLATSVNHLLSGNRFSGSITINAAIPAANKPLFTGNWGTGAITGPANANAFSNGNT